MKKALKLKVEEQQPDLTSSLLEHSMALNDQNAKNHSQAIDNVLEHQGQIAQQHGQLLEHNLEMHGETQKKMDDGADKIATVLKDALPQLMQMGGAAEFIMYFLKVLRGEKGDQGIKGDDGKTPELGVDYLTPPQVVKFIKHIQSNIQIPADGKTPQKGVDYFTPSEIESFIEAVQKRVKPGVDGKPGADGKPGPKGEKGNVGEGLSEAETLTIRKFLRDAKKSDIMEKITPEFLLEKLKGKINYKEIVGAPEFKQMGGGTGYLREITDVEILTAPTNGQVLTFSTAKNKWIPGTGGGGGSGGSAAMEIATPTGSPSVWTLVNLPAIIIVDNQPMYDGVGVTVTGSGPYTLTLVNPAISVAALHNGTNMETATGSGTVWSVTNLPIIIIADNQPFYNGVGVDVTGSGPYTLTFANAATQVATLHN